jgi:hypothetical protein
MPVFSDASGDDPRLVGGVVIGAVVAVALWGASRVWREVRKRRE